MITLASDDNVAERWAMLYVLIINLTMETIRKVGEGEIKERDGRGRVLRDKRLFIVEAKPKKTCRFRVPFALLNYMKRGTL
jgi:hypothetical protein